MPGMQKIQRIIASQHRRKGATDNDGALPLPFGKLHLIIDLTHYIASFPTTEVPYECRFSSQCSI